jgi:hypothetical protein
MEGTKSMGGREGLAEVVRASLPEPVSERQDGTGLLFISEAVPEVALRLTDKGVDVLLYRRIWAEPDQLVDQHHLLTSVPWKGLPDQVEQAWALLETPVRAPQKQRASSYRTCQRCGKSTPPEFMHNEQLCMSCAALVLGVIY